MTARDPSIHADGPDARPRAVPPRRLGLRGEGRRVARPRVQGRRPRPPRRSGRDQTRRFRDIAGAISKLSARTVVLDGEVAIYDEKLRSRFEWLREPDPAAVATPPMFMVFDLLHRDGRDLIGRPLRERRARLEDVV